jgi:hypothetical protein
MLEAREKERRNSKIYVREKRDSRLDDESFSMMVVGLTKLQTVTIFGVQSNIKIYVHFF